MILHMYKTGNNIANTSPLRTYNTWNNLTYTLHAPLKHRILHANTLLKSINRCLFILIKSNHNASTSNDMPFRHLAKPTRDPINIYQTSSNVQLTSNIPFTHLFVL